MTTNIIKADARIVQTVRTLKEHPNLKQDKKLSNISDKSSDNTSGNSKDEKIEIKRNSIIKNSLRRPSTKISIDGSENLQNNLNNDKNIINKDNKILLNNLKGRLSQSINVPVNNNFSPISKNSILLHSMNLTNGIKKGKSKYIQSLLSDMSIKKYKQSCISMLKEDNLIKQLYEENGFEKSNFSYDNFIEKNFFNSSLFMFKLEITLMSEDNFTKKNFKEKFFKKEIINYLQRLKNDKDYINKKNNLKSEFTNHFNFIKNFNLLQ
jgi:hypothetical protein